jgi:hypothetical protein
MRHVRRTFWMAGILPLVLAAGGARAQSTATSSDPDSVTPVPDTAPEAKKKGGLFGKVKGLAGNKTVQAVAKTAACTMVPGGQVIAGAIDAASSKDVGEAAVGAAGAASGQTCMPGLMGGMGAGAAAGALPGGVGALPGAGGLGAAAGAAGLAGSLVSGAAAGGMMPGAAMAGMAPGAMAYGGTGGPSNPEEMAACLGLTVEELQTLTDPTGGEPRQLTKKEMQQQQQLAAQIDMQRYQGCMMEQSTTGMASTGQAMSESRASGNGSATEAAAGGNASEAPGKSVALASDPAADLAKGKMVIRDIDWIAYGGEISAEGAPAFRKAMATLAAALAQAKGTYRADIYLDKRYDDSAVEPLGSARLQTVQRALEAAGVASGVVTTGKAKKDKKPRLEIVKVRAK